jgi:hypothetical protein
VALLLQDTQQEGTFARTHTLIVACTSPICLLYWLGTCVNFIPNSEGSVALFLSVVCPMLFLQSIVCRSAVHCLKSQRAVLLSQVTQREGAFTFFLLPSEIAFIFSTIYDNLVTMKDYFLMLKSSVPPQCTEGLLIRVQPNTYIEKTEHFWTASHLVKQRGQLNKGYNTQEVWEIQPSFAGVYCVFSGLCNKPHWQDFKLVSNRGNAARTSGINGDENNKAGANDEVTCPVPLEGTTKEDVMQMVEATAMVYKVLEEQHKMDSFVPKEPAILKDEMRLNEFALQLCCTHGMPEPDTNGRPANIFEMNTSIATLSAQCGDENSLYLEGKRVKPQCFSCHVDDKNDPEYRDVWVVYKHVQDPNSHLWFRVGNVFSYCMW